MSSEVNAQKCGWCEVAILLDHEDHHWDEDGVSVYHNWCAEEAADAALDLREEVAIEEAREDGDL